MVYNHVPHQNILESLVLPQVKVVCQCHALKPVFLVAIQTIFSGYTLQDGAPTMVIYGYCTYFHQLH